MINRSSLKTFTTILSPLACLELLSTAQAQEGDLGGGNTNERFHALLNVSSGGFNTGLGWYSEWFLTTGFFSSAVGAGSLDLNNGDSNTAVGTAAMLLNFPAQGTRLLEPTRCSLMASPEPRLPLPRTTRRWHPGAVAKQGWPVQHRRGF
jgi:hypothetical protein